MMRLACLLLLTMGLLAAGCGGGSGSNQTAESPPATSTPAPAPRDTTVALPTTSQYDDGPRAGAAPVKATMAAAGEKLFQSKGCVVCHGFGKVVTCPDLVGVSTRRTALWMENQILHPEVMVKEDRISAELKTHHALPMTNQGLTPEEARSVIEFLKKKDKDAGAKGPAS